MVPWVADVQTAVVAKEALEGHCIYDGGFCKLHLSYSRHSDLSIKVTRHSLRIKFFFPAHHDTVHSYKLKKALQSNCFNTFERTEKD